MRDDPFRDERFLDLFPISAQMEEIKVSNLFKQMLYEKARRFASLRGTKTITDADIRRAYEDITRAKERDWRRSIIAESLVILGSSAVGAGIAAYLESPSCLHQPLNELALLCLLLGLPLIVAGLYIRGL